VAAWKPERAKQRSAASSSRVRRAACWSAESLGMTPIDNERSLPI
jgi:hypothetical protein